MITKTILDRIGWTGVLKLAWKATPVWMRPFSLPYNLWVYGSFCRQSSNERELWRLHDYHSHTSAVYRHLRPRYTVIVSLLEDYGVEIG